jgi:hypothetical protein
MYCFVNWNVKWHTSVDLVFVIPWLNSWNMPVYNVGWDWGISVGTVTRYVLEGPGIESRWGRDFLHPSRPALGPNQTPIQWVPGLFPRVKAAGCVALTTYPHLAPRLKKE